MLRIGKNISIRNKIILLATTVSFFSLMLGLLFSTISQIKKYQADITAFIQKDANLIGDYCVMPLEFNYPERAEQILEKLRQSHDYVCGAVYNNHDSLFASSCNEQEEVNVKLTSNSTSIELIGEFLIVREPIMYNDMHYGTIYLKLKSSLKEDIRDQIMISLGILTGMLLLALFFSFWFQRFITVPILKLADTASEIAKNENYSIQLKKSGKDEIGVLYDKFNAMLRTINLREAERDQAVHAMAVSEENFRNIFNLSSDGIILSHMSGSFIEVNDTFCKMIGFTASYLKTLDPDSITLPEFKKRWPEILERLKIYGEATYEHTLLASKTKLIPVEVNSRKIIYKEQEVILSMIRDITERKKSEEALKAETEVNRVIANISREIISPEISINSISMLIQKASKKLTDSNYGFVSWIDPKSNEEILLTADPELSAIIDKTRRINNSDGDKKKLIWDNALITHQGFFTNAPEDMYKNTQLMKEMHSILNYMSIPAVAGDKVLGQVALANSHTGFDNEKLEIIRRIANIYSIAVLQKQTNEDLLTAKIQAEESDKLKSAFLANMSHEIRTPMNGILGFSELLKERSLDSKALNRYIDIITKSSRRLSDIINDIIDISKIESGVINIENTTFKLNPLFEDLLSFFQPGANEKKVELEYIRSPEAEIVIYSDRTKVNQILTNLLSNAIKFTHTGRIEFGAKVHSTERRVSIYVRDTGIGIEPEYLDTIFYRFRQIETSITREYGGTGLGLAISKAFAQALGGDLTVESMFGKGSEFTFTLQYHKLEEDTAGVTPEYDAKWEPDLRGRQILIVEDEQYNYEYLHEILQNTHVNISWVRNGEDALTEFWKNQKNIDLILMDIKLPVMDGLATTRRIREQNTRVPIIALTAYALAGDSERALESGCNAYLPKPVDKQKLFQLFTQYLIKS